jgi:threonine/homoserine/homoserine lactone efflux protein
MKLILIFLVTCWVSAAGSLQLGPVNVAVIRASITRSLSVAMWVALGGCLPEILYGLVALHGVMFFEEHPRIFQFLQWAIVPVLWLAGAIVLLRPPPPAQMVEWRKPSRRLAVVEGLVLALFNPQLLAFWALVLLQFQNTNFLKINQLSHQIAFLLGTSCGAMGILGVWAWLARRYREPILQRLRGNRLHQLIGLLFILLGVVQLVKMLL